MTSASMAANPVVGPARDVKTEDHAKGVETETLPAQMTLQLLLITPLVALQRQQQEQCPYAYTVNADILSQEL